MDLDREAPRSNPSSARSFTDLVAARLERRRFLAGGLVAAGAALLSPLGALGISPARAQGGLLGFTGIPLSTSDTVTVPSGYTAEVLYAWGDPISTGPRFKGDASESAEDQLVQSGMHHDGLHFFPLPAGSASSTHGLLAVNHEYTDDGLLHVGGMETWPAEKVRKSQAAHGVSVVEIRYEVGRWGVVRPSTYARRISSFTPIQMSGPAAGHPWLQTAADPSGRTVMGTVNNCACGYTPWGTYLTCEENFNGYFVNRSGALPPLQKRYGINDKGFGYRWHEHDERFDT